MHPWSIVLRTVALSVFVAILATAGARAACVESGGTEFCGSPVPGPWTHIACDEAGSFLFRAAAWCTASGGTNTGSSCSGATPHTEENIVARSVQFADLVHGSTCSIASDTGWGASFASNLCWNGGDTYGSGILSSTSRRLGITCPKPNGEPGGGELISLRKVRANECPLGYTLTRNPDTGTLGCKRPLEDCDGCGGIGNPITPGTGVKVQSEVDYRHALGLQFSRHYHSFQFYEPLSWATGGVHTENRLGAVWRTGFDKRIIELVPASPFVKSGISLPSGEVQYFDAAGKEIFNYRGASGTLVTVAGTGYYYKGPDSTEFYGTDGRLRSISLASGQVFTLTYSDGTSGPNGGFILDAAGNPGLLVLPANSLIRVADLQGNALAFGYDIERRIVIMTDPGGGQYRYSYDASSNLISVKYPDTRVRTYRYNELANMVSGASIRYALTSIVDENDELFASFKYDTSGRAVSTEHASGAQRYQLTYNASDTNITDPLATPRTVGFATVGGVSRYTGVSQPGGAGYSAGVKTRSHDSNGNVTSRTDFNDVVTCYAYDSVRNLETVRVEGLPAGMSCAAVLDAGAALPAGSRKIVTEWHARWRLPLRVSEPLRRTSFAYNGDGAASCAPASALIAEGGAADQPIAVLCIKNMEATADADGAQGFGAAAAGPARLWTYSYNALGQALTADGPRTEVADVTSYVYNAQGNLASVTNAAGHVTSITAHNAHGQPLTVVDPNGVTTTLAYDTRQRLTSRSIGGETTSYDYDGVGQLTRVTLPDGSFLAYTYDAAHRLTQIADNLGNRIAYTLDAMGNRTAEEVRDPANQLAQTRSRIYSNLNRLAQEIGAQSQTTSYAYDNQGNVTTIDGPLPGTVDVTTNAYDALNRLVRVTDPNAGQVNYGYTALDQLTSVSDPRSLTTSYAYDGLNNLNQQVSPDTGTTVNTYDAAGNLLTQTDAKGQVTRYAYDALNRVTSIVYQGGATHSYQYDQGVNGLGRLTQVTEPHSTTQYAYDPKGRLTSETRIINAVSYVTGYSYDASGRLTGMTYPSGRQVSYTLDSLGRIQQIATTKDATTQTVVSSVAYRPFGPAQGFTFGNGQTYSRGFDQDGRIASYTLAVQSFAVGYDAASRIGFLSDIANPANTNTYSYDSLDRLTGAVLPGTPFAYSYDAVGNRLSKTVGASTDSYAYGATSNRLSSITPGAGPLKTYVHDAVGSVTADGTNSYAYDTRGRLVQANTTIGPVQYQVNALGQRIAKIAPGSGGGGSQTLLSDTFPGPDGRAIDDQADGLWKGGGKQVAARVSGGQAEIAPRRHLRSGAEFALGAEGLILTAKLVRGKVALVNVAQDEGLIVRYAGSTVAVARARDDDGDDVADEANVRARFQLSSPGAVLELVMELRPGAARVRIAAGGESFDTGEIALSGVQAGERYRVRLAAVQLKGQALSGLADDVRLSVPGGGAPLAVTTHFVYDMQGRLIGEYTGQGVMLREYAYLQELPLALFEPGGGVHFVHTDHLNTPRRIYNQASQLVWSWDNTDPFGGNVPDENPSGLGTFTCNLRFPGTYADKETGLLYNWWRTLDTTLGRYIQSDPIGLAGGINTYAYVGNNPLSNIDPDGLLTLTMCQMNYLNNNYGMLGGFLASTFNVQQFIPGMTDDLVGGLTKGAVVGGAKLGVVAGLNYGGSALAIGLSGTIGSDIGMLMIASSALASGTLVVCGAGLTPFATIALANARQACLDPISGKQRP